MDKMSTTTVSPPLCAVNPKSVSLVFRDCIFHIKGKQVVPKCNNIVICNCQK